MQYHLTLFIAEFENGIIQIGCGNVLVKPKFFVKKELTNFWEVRIPNSNYRKAELVDWLKDHRHGWLWWRNLFNVDFDYAKEQAELLCSGKKLVVRNERYSWEEDDKHGRQLPRKYIQEASKDDEYLDTQCGEIRIRNKKKRYPVKKPFEVRFAEGIVELRPVFLWAVIIIFCIWISERLFSL